MRGLAGGWAGWEPLIIRKCHTWRQTAGLACASGPGAVTSLRFLASVPRGLADLLAKELDGLRRERCAGADDGRGVHRLARDRLPRLSRVAARESGISGDRALRGRERGRLLRRRPRVRLEPTPGARRHARLRFQRQASDHHPQPLRRSEAQGRDRRHAARSDRGSARHCVGSARVSGCTRMPTAPRSPCPSISPVRVCTAAAIAGRPARRP